MSIVLFRVDERLIHGQVVLGWGGELHPQRYLVVDDDLAGSAWEQELYRLSVPDEVAVVFTDVPGGRAALSGWRDDDVRSVLLTRDVAAMAALGGDGGLEGAEINLGGIHPRPGRTEVRPYLFLDDADRAGVRALVTGGAAVTGRDLPGASRVPVEQILA